MPLSAVALIAPLLAPEIPKTTTSPPVAIRLPAASFARSRKVARSPEITVLAEAVTADVAGEMRPGVTVIVGSAGEIAMPLIVAPIVVPVPASTPVKTAVYTPSPLSAAALMVPVLDPPDDEKTTRSPPVVMLVPEPSFPCSRSLTVLPESTVPVDTVTVDVAAEIAVDVADAVNDATTLASSHGLDFLELVAGDGSIVSSAQWPARFAYKEAGLTKPADCVVKSESFPVDELKEYAVLQPRPQR